MLDPTIRKIDKFNSFKDSLSKKEQVTAHYFSVGDRKLNILYSNLKLRNSCMNAEQEMLTLPEHLISPLVLIDAHVVLSFVSPYFM